MWEITATIPYPGLKPGAISRSHGQGRGLLLVLISPASGKRPGGGPNPGGWSHGAIATCVRSGRSRTSCRSAVYVKDKYQNMSIRHRWIVTPMPPPV